MEVVASLSQDRTAAAQCGLFTYKSVPVIFEPPCIMSLILGISGYDFRKSRESEFDILVGEGFLLACGVP